MKNFKRALVLLVALVLVFSLTSCDKSESIKRAFEKEGWSVKTVNADDSGVKTVLKLLLSDKQIEDLADYEIIWYAHRQPQLPLLPPSRVFPQDAL